jgi:hypothetical protein
LRLLRGFRTQTPNRPYRTSRAEHRFDDFPEAGPDGNLARTGLEQVCYEPSLTACVSSNHQNTTCQDRFGFQ